MLPCVGIFGSDSHAKTMITIFRSVGFTVSGIWASTREKAKQTASSMEIPFYTCKLDELLLRNDVDIVCVCGSPHQYAEVAKKALSIGKHVFSSAPAGLSLRDAEKMVSAAQYYPQLLSLMNHPLRFLTSYVKARELISNGYCGKLLVCECTVHTDNLVGLKYDWHCDQSMGGGVLHTFGCHVIDALSFLFDEHAREAQGIMQTFVKHIDSMPSFRQITSDDFCTFHLKYNSGLHASVTLNSHMPKDFNHEVLIVGTKGYLRLKNGDLYGGTRGEQPTNPSSSEVCLHKHKCSLVKLGSDIVESQPNMYLHGLVSLIEGVKSAFQSTQNTDRRNADHNLIAAAANFEDGFYVRAVMDAVIDSNKNGEWVKISFNSSAKTSCENPFWLLNQSNLNAQQKEPVASKTVESKKKMDTETSKTSSPKNAKREKVK
eukprot:gene18627-20505_t